MKIDVTKLEEISVATIDIRDMPDFTDAFIESASYEGRDLTDEELDELNKNHDFVYSEVIKRVFG